MMQTPYKVTILNESNSYVGQNIEYSTLKRVGKKVIRNEDKQQMQEDLRSIYSWAKANKIEFNSKKFEQIIHGSTKNVSVEPYELSSEDQITIKKYSEIPWSIFNQ